MQSLCKFAPRADWRNQFYCLQFQHSTLNPNQKQMETEEAPLKVAPSGAWRLGSRCRSTVAMRWQALLSSLCAGPQQGSDWQGRFVFLSRLCILPAVAEFSCAASTGLTGFCTERSGRQRRRVSRKLQAFKASPSGRSLRSQSSAPGTLCAPSF